MRLHGTTLKQCGAEYNRLRSRMGFAPYKGEASLKQGLHGPVTLEHQGQTYTLMLDKGRPAPEPR